MGLFPYGTAIVILLILSQAVEASLIGEEASRFCSEVQQKYPETSKKVFINIRTGQGS